MWGGCSTQDLPQYVYIPQAHLAPAFIKFRPLKNLSVADLDHCSEEKLVTRNSETFQSPKHLKEGL